MNTTKFDRICEASEQYEHDKPGAGHRVTLSIVARRFNVSVYDLWNHRRDLSSPRKKKSRGFSVSRTKSGDNPKVARRHGFLK